MDMDGPGFPRVALGLAWLSAAIGAAVVAGLVGGPPGKVLFGVAVLEAIVMAAVASNKGRATTLALSALAGTLVIATGIITAVIAALTAEVPLAQALVIAAILTATGLIAGRMTSRAKRMVRG